MRDGRIVLEDGTILVGRMAEADFLQTPAGRKAVVRSKHGIYCRYSLQDEVTLGERTFVLDVQFAQGRLDNISMQHSTGENSWNNYDEAEERANGDEDVAWVRKHFGAPPPCDFSWGRVWAGFVPRDGFSTVIFRYAPA